MSINELKALAKTVINHNHGFNALAWEVQSKEVHGTTHSLVWIPNLNDWSGRRRQILDSIDSAQSAEGIAKLMNTDESRRGHLRVWNFWPVVAIQTDSSATTSDDGLRPTGFVEYNLASGSATHENAVMWIDLACLFVRGALKHNGRWHGTPKGSDPNLFREGDLRQFVLEQAQDARLSEAERARLQERLGFLR
ncbi:hypothetical protein F4859DRAFT_509855 [Xylaria cf. heliscus]|nr:hypothetical protein F4859DRAFT_509855 [Xylaria cf. heliscus]